MKTKSLILMHNPTEGAGLFDTILKEKGWTREILPLFEGRSLPESTDEFGLILVMGGPMSVNDEDRFPFLKQEILFIRQMIKLGKPVLGICLGAQLMAKSLGARVYPGPHKEIGWYFLNQTPSGKADPLFSLLDPCFLVFQWHGETFDLPNGGICLAGNQVFPQQAFRFGDRAYGLQFHFEVTEGMIKTWLKQWAGEIKTAKPQPLSARDILQDSKVYLDRLQKQVRIFFGRYLELLKEDVVA
ncbi:MAG: gamma-glutamyl-gamma-aminobutyrate hydrolase family protein [Thermodesulfobacteriota bacterium]